MSSEAHKRVLQKLYSIKHQIQPSSTTLNQNHLFILLASITFLGLLILIYQQSQIKTDPKQPQPAISYAKYTSYVLFLIFIINCIVIYSNINK